MALALTCAALSAETVTLPAAASIVGGAPFFSDVRAFNTSYTASLTVDATYRCFIGSPCPATAPQMTFTLAPRESRAFDDIVVSAFHAPNSAGGVEFDHSGSSGQLVVTSRLFSTAPTPTVGMFIPGLDDSVAHPVTVLTSIRNRGAGAGFRTNVGVFNPEDAAVTVTFSIFDNNGAAVGVPVSRPVAGHSGVQVSGIFNVAGAGAADFATENAVIVVSSTGEVFSYAAVIDNATTDPIFVIGAEDQPPQPITPGVTSTPTRPDRRPRDGHAAGPHADTHAAGRRDAHRQRRSGRRRHEIHRPGQRHEHVDDPRGHDDQLGVGRQPRPLDDVASFLRGGVGLRRVRSRPTVSRTPSTPPGRLHTSARSTGFR